jgi:exportin-2 (importin alpha re-exporter)
VSLLDRWKLRKKMDNNAKIYELFNQTLSDVKLQRAKAEQELSQICRQPGFSTLLLQSLVAPDSQIPVHIKSAMATYFKNHVKNKWSEIGVISDEEKEFIKQNLPGLMLSLQNNQLKKIIAASLNIVSTFEFPEKWQNLLPDLVEKLKTNDFNMINGVLKTIDAIFKRFRDAYDSDAVQMTHMKFILEVFSTPFLYLFKAITEQITIKADDPKTLEVLFKTVRHLCSIYLSLNSATIPEFMEDNLPQFMGSFKFFLTYKSNAPELMESGKDESASGLLTKVKVVVLTIINLNCEKYEEEFQPYIEQFVTEVWQLLLATGPETKFDSLVTSSLQFLTTISTGVFHTLFQNDDVLAQICNNVIVPNIKLRKSDKELFEDDPMAYVAKDIEGNDDGTRRRSAFTLVLGLRKNYEEKLTGLFSNHVNILLQEYSANPSKNWAAKDAAVFIIIALAASKGTSEKGVTTVNALVPVLEFYKNQILVELQSEKCPDLLVCSCLNFATTFRRQLSLDDFHALLTTAIIKNLRSSSPALQSYASVAIERFLAIREDNNQYRFQKEHISGLMQPLFENLFAALDCGGTSENPYVMKAIGQVLTIAKETITPVLTPAIQALSQKLLMIYAAPVSAEFGHYMFESIAALISFTCKIDAPNIDKFEEGLFPIFQKILTEPGAETFAPYVFQVMAQFIELRRTLDPKYLPLLPVLTEVQYWEETGNRPALVRLIQDFIIYGAANFNAESLPPVLGIFQKLLSNKQQDYLAFFLLESIVSSLDKNLVAGYMPQIFKLIFTRLQSSKTEPLVRSFILFLSNFIAACGVPFVMEQLNAAQNGIFTMILTSLWVPNVSKISGQVERKAIACGTISLLSSDMTGTFFQNDQGAATLRDLIASLILLFTGEISKVAADSSYVDAGELVYNSGFNALKMATKLPTDYFAKVENAQTLFAHTLKEISTKYGQKASQVLGALPAENKESLVAILKSANVTL